ncbi:gremlin-1-like [Lepisosteus oculatus]|uniref:Gremlin-1 n=1 Tax=Lepisosteus oculatus TaxID=7918 RepID=W5NA82_LEPOC|nr:PREDICTED: gremlin-1-like [Lepisosteus oculatus]
MGMALRTPLLLILSTIFLCTHQSEARTEMIGPGRVSGGGSSLSLKKTQQPMRSQNKEQLPQLQQQKQIVATSLAELGPGGGDKDDAQPIKLQNRQPQHRGRTSLAEQSVGGGDTDDFLDAKALRLLKMQQQQQQIPTASPAGLVLEGRDKDEILDADKVVALFVTERRFVRRDWCESRPLVHTVRVQGCLSRAVIVRFCYGQCNSFYIPGVGGDGGGAFRSCSYCQPRQLGTLAVTLTCPTLRPPTRLQRLTVVRECRCTSIELD